MSVLRRHRKEKFDETRALVLRALGNRRIIESDDMDSIIEELLEDIQEQWEGSSPCDIDERDVYEALKKLHSTQAIKVRHRDPATGEVHHRVKLASVYDH